MIWRMSNRVMILVTKTFKWKHLNLNVVVKAGEVEVGVEGLPKQNQQLKERKGILFLQKNVEY